MTARDIVMGAAGNSGDSKTYIEDVFSTYLYTGNGSSQTINNGIDLAGKGGMVWLKNRDGTYGHKLLDTARGANNTLSTNTSNQQYNTPSINWSFNSNGFSQSNGWYDFNGSGSNYASWTFRKAPKFFDVVTWTGNGVNGRKISHSLGVTPGMIFVKDASDPNGNWWVWHKDKNGGNGNMWLNSTDAGWTDNGALWGNGSTYTAPSSTDFTVSDYLGGAGDTYVAYLFAHDTTTDGLIQCGSFNTGSTGSCNVNLGWEPQYLMIKRSSGTGDWIIIDNMRGFCQTTDNGLSANSSAAETGLGNQYIVPTATGFQADYTLAFNSDYIYMAIRRGPMRTPTDATKVYQPVARTGTGTNVTLTDVPFPADLAIIACRNNDVECGVWDRLRDKNRIIRTNSTAAESTAYTDEVIGFDTMTGVRLGYSPSGVTNIGWGLGWTYINYLFRRAPGFFDVVCFSMATNGPVPHSLGVTPELIIYKTRDVSDAWCVYSASLGINAILKLNTTAAAGTEGTNYWTSTPPTATNIYAGSFLTYFKYVAYLFASCPGVSKVGSYTGNGSSQTINCGFSAGARFVLIKRTDSTGDWYIWDTARGIVAGNDPHSSLNTGSAEVTSDDTIDPDSSGFIVNQVYPTNVNESGASYIFLAIA